jgi:glycosyltransferase involved in cell wall biosynthesis
MLSKKPVVAANHGGLKEIVVHNETGLLFEANNPIDLINQLEKLIINKELRINFGINGFNRVKKIFSTTNYINSFEKEYKNLS